MRDDQLDDMLRQALEAEDEAAAPEPSWDDRIPFSRWYLGLLREDFTEAERALIESDPSLQRKRDRVARTLWYPSFGQLVAYHLGRLPQDLHDQIRHHLEVDRAARSLRRSAWAETVANAANPARLLVLQPGLARAQSAGEEIPESEGASADGSIICDLMPVADHPEHLVLELWTTRPAHRNAMILWSMYAASATDASAVEEEPHLSGYLVLHPVDGEESAQSRGYTAAVRLSHEAVYAQLSAGSEASQLKVSVVAELIDAALLAPEDEPKLLESLQAAAVNPVARAAWRAWADAAMQHELPEHARAVIEAVGRELAD